MHRYYPTQNLARLPARFLTLGLLFSLGLSLAASALLPLSRLNFVELEPSLLMLPFELIDAR